MSEGFFTIEIDSYGFMLDTNWCYLALSWQMIAIATTLLIAYKIYKRKKNK
jgi:hypothetical protein